MCVVGEGACVQRETDRHRESVRVCVRGSCSSRRDRESELLGGAERQREGRQARQQRSDRENDIKNIIKTLQNIIKH
jgi:hypothetical protein